MMKYSAKFLLIIIFLCLSCSSGIAGETWVLMGSMIEPKLLNAPIGSYVHKKKIAGFGWLIDLQSIFRQGNTVFYHERFTMIDKYGNSIKEMEHDTVFLRIVDCTKRLMKLKENDEWSQGTPEHKPIINYLCPKRKIQKGTGDVI